MERFIVACFRPDTAGRWCVSWTCTYGLTDPEQARREYALINRVPLSTVYYEPMGG